MHSYFEPKAIERCRGRSIYEFLGVRFFKKYLLPIDLVIFRLRGRRQVPVDRGKLKLALERLEWETKRNEVIHLLFILAVAGIVVAQFSRMSVTQFLWVFGLNLYANVYPIFVQRYNRSRITKLLRREENGAKEKPQNSDFKSG
jgi:hypothetical protein